MYRSIGICFLFLLGLGLGCGTGNIDSTSASGQESYSIGVEQWPVELAPILSVNRFQIEQLSRRQYELSYEVWLYDPSHHSGTEFLYQHEMTRVEDSDSVLNINNTLRARSFKGVMMSGQYLGVRLGYRSKGSSSYTFGDPVWVPFTSDMEWFKTHSASNRVPTALVKDSSGALVAQLRSTLSSSCNARFDCDAFLPVGPVDRQDVAFLLSRFPSNPVEFADVGTVRNAFKEVQARFLEYSDGRVLLEGKNDPVVDIFGWYDLGIQIQKEPLTDCPTLDALDATIAAADNAGVDLALYDLRVYGFAWNDCIYPGGVALWDGPSVRADTYIYRDAPMPDVIVHETGHNLGLPEVYGMKCELNGVPVAIGGDCVDFMYQDPADAMGGGSASFNGLYKRKLGWLARSNVRTVGAGVYFLRPLEMSTKELQLIMIPHGDGEVLGIEYRLPPPNRLRASGKPVPSGVFLRLQREGKGTRLIDNNPDKLDYWKSFEDAALAPGATFYDTLYGLEITTLREDASGALVRIEYKR